MDITIHHTISLSGSAMLAIALILVVFAFCALYPMTVAMRQVPIEPERPQGKMGFV